MTSPFVNILVGCDRVSTLPELLRSMDSLRREKYRIIPALRISDIKQLATTIDCHLYVLYYRNNQEALSCLNKLTLKTQIPVLCISDNIKQSLSWGDEQIVFTCTYEETRTERFLTSLINSILLLQSRYPLLETTERTTTNSEKETQTLELEQKTNTLLHVKNHIERLFSQTDKYIQEELKPVISLIKQSISRSKGWDNMNILFHQNDLSYINELTNKHPQLTPIDVKYCCYIKMNLSNDEIKDILGISQESVRTHKYRLKKKLSLRKELSLHHYLHSITRRSN
jgi:DNA-binding CsgD family transcriptional regulator